MPVSIVASPFPEATALRLGRDRQFGAPGARRLGGDDVSRAGCGGIDSTYPGHGLQLRRRRSPMPRLPPGPSPTTSTPPRTCWHWGSSLTWWGTSGSTGDGPEGKPVPAVSGRLPQGERHLARATSPSRSSWACTRISSSLGGTTDFRRDPALRPTNLAKYGIKTLALTESCAACAGDQAVRQHRRHLPGPRPTSGRSSASRTRPTH